ncbi:MAG: glutaminase A [Peptoniphilus harei]|nr:glutaminase A [Peptoniphilus harei]
MDKILDSVIEYGKEFVEEGKLVDYIPILRDADKTALGVCLIDKDGKIYEAGKSREKFAIMSIVKVILFEIVLENYEIDEIKKYIGFKGSSKPYDSILDLELEKGKPINPFVNAGAIMSSYLIYKKFKDKSVDVLFEKAKTLTENKDIDYARELMKLTSNGGENNLALTYILKKHGYIDKETNIEDVLYIYNLACCIMVNTKDLAVLSSIISRNGINLDGKRVMEKDHARILRTLMSICGTYDYSGDFAINIGIPAKSGVGGGIMATTNKDIGVCAFCPGLDRSGNSIAGVKMLEMISKKLDLGYY